MFRSCDEDPPEPHIEVLVLFMCLDGEICPEVLRRCDGERPFWWQEEDDACVTLPGDAVWCTLEAGAPIIQALRGLQQLRNLRSRLADTIPEVIAAIEELRE